MIAALFGGTAIQYSSMPLLAYGIGRLFGLEGPWMIGIVMVGCVPGAIATEATPAVAVWGAVNMPIKRPIPAATAPAQGPRTKPTSA